MSGQTPERPAARTGAHSARRMTSREMARIASPGCEGCGICCRGMGDTIRLDPMDVWRLTAALGAPFSDLLDRVIGLHAEEGLVLPHMRMDGATDACALLGEDGRCSLHASRPGICRLFPLGREYEGETFRYFFPEEGCPRQDLRKVRICDWIGLPEIDRYERFVGKWHALVRRQQALAGKAIASGHDEWARRRAMQLLQDFYTADFGVTEDDFYRTFEAICGEKPWIRPSRDGGQVES